LLPTQLQGGQHNPVTRLNPTSGLQVQQALRGLATNNGTAGAIAKSQVNLLPAP
jgi:hypothetical protein